MNPVVPGVFTIHPVPDPTGGNGSLMYMTPALIVQVVMEPNTRLPLRDSPVWPATKSVPDIGMVAQIAPEMSSNVPGLAAEMIEPSGENVGGGAWTATEKMLEEVFI